MSLTFADAAELVLREEQRAMKPSELWSEIERRGLVESQGATPVATLRVELQRSCAGSSLAQGRGQPRFYRRGDGAYGLLANLSAEQQKAVRQAATSFVYAPQLTVRAFRGDREEMRRRPEVAQQVLESLVPVDSQRRAAAELFASLIRVAAEHGPMRWKVTLGPRSYRLTVGSINVVEIVRRGFWFDADLSVLSADERATVEGLTARDFESGPPAVYPSCTSHYAPFDLVSECAEAIRAAVAPIIPVAAREREVVHGARYHSPAVIEWLEQYLATTLPRPTIDASGTGADDEDEEEAPVGAGGRRTRDEELSLDDLLREMLDTHVTTNEGRAALARYDEERITAREHWARIHDLEQRGEDVTDAVLLGTLPYSDSARHREQGAWICHAPVILGELKVWFEKAGWVQPDAWPDVAEALLTFLRSCLEAPAELAAHVARFVADPRSKGLGVAMVSPFLSALAPEHFVLVNAKVLRVLDYFAGRRLEPELATYPIATREMHELVRQQERLADSRLEGMRPADAFDHFCHWLVAVRGFSFPDDGAPDGSAYWKISPGAGAELWDDWQREGIAAVGWNSLGDLSEVRDEAEFRARVEAARAAGKDYNLAGARQAWHLARMAVGTHLIANRGMSEVVGLGRVTAPYYYVEGDELAHRVRVDWFDKRRRVIDRPGWVRTLIELDRATFEEIAAAGATVPPEPPPGSGEDVVVEPPPRPSYTRADFVRETGFDDGEAERWLRILQAKRQVIVQGPPGTGKTYVAERLAKLAVNGASERIQLVQFHPAYSYEDFIQGIRPRATPQGLAYEMLPGRFLDFCSNAVGPEPWVMIIDEINRANLPRVFGELMYLLEYRDRERPLAGGGTLRIPGNVYLIGTMNTADRSIARLDHALRRRFSFLRLGPDLGTLRGFGEREGLEQIQALIETIERINRAIDDENFSLGISYFLRTDLGTALPDVWRCEIEPYLEEYFFDRPRVVDDFRWSRLGGTGGHLAAWGREE